MRDKAIAIISFLGLLLGAGALYYAETTPTTCLPQTIGQVYSCPSQPSQGWEIPTLIIVVSAIGLIYSFLPFSVTRRATTN